MHTNIGKKRLLWKSSGRRDGTDMQYEGGGRMRKVRQRSDAVRCISNSSFAENCGQRSGVSHRRDTADWRWRKTTAGEGHKDRTRG